MNAPAANAAKLVKVICAECAKEADCECKICHGARFHLWDPLTTQCFASDGAPLVVVDSDGEEVFVHRDPGKLASPEAYLIDRLLEDAPSFERMMEFVEHWILQSPVRKWNLTLNDEGWHACVWFNRYKKICFDTCDASLQTCVERSYLEIKRRSEE